MDTDRRTTLILGYLVGSIAFFAPILGFIAPKGLAPLVIFGSIAGFVVLKAQKRQIYWISKPIIILLGCLCLWAAFSIFWSIDGRSALFGTIKLLGNMIIGGILFSIFRSLTNVESKIVMRWFLIGFLSLLGLLLVELFLGHPIYSAIKNVELHNLNIGGPFWLNTAVVILILLVWPLCIALVKLGVEKIDNPKLLFIVICAVALALILAFLIKFHSGIMALIFGIFGTCVIWIFGRRAAIAASVLLVLSGLLLPFALTEFEDPVFSLENIVSLPNSAKHRISIWNFTAEKIDQKMLVGWGMNASKNMPGGKVLLSIYSKSVPLTGDALPLHPHNAMLQMWLELGLPGIILYLTLGVSILMSVASRFRSKFESSMIVGQFVTALVIANLSFGVWQAWWVATLWLSASLMAMMSNRKSVGYPQTVKQADEEAAV